MKRAEEECEVLHGVPCEVEEVEISSEVDELLPAGDLLELGALAGYETPVGTLNWIDHEGHQHYHHFGHVKVYAAGSGVIYLVGDFKLTEAGIVNG
jgi:hypothetical protein